MRSGPCHLHHRLEHLLQPQFVEEWLRTPIPALDDEAPIELIARGEHTRVAALVSALEEAPYT